MFANALPLYSEREKANENMIISPIKILKKE
jgi:hypothetical protein